MLYLIKVISYYQENTCRVRQPLLRMHDAVKFVTLAVYNSCANKRDPKTNKIEKLMKSK